MMPESHVLEVLQGGSRQDRRRSGRENRRYATSDRESQASTPSGRSRRTAKCKMRDVANSDSIESLLSASCASPAGDAATKHGVATDGMIDSQEKEGPRHFGRVAIPIPFRLASRVLALSNLPLGTPLKQGADESS
jgi:hypothetical protein